MDSSQLVCPKCGTIAIPGSKFCSTCGTLLPIGPVTLSVSRQIWIYFVSFFLPPLGLVWVFKYFRSTSPQLQRIALIATILTVVSIILTIWATAGIFQTVQSQLNTYQNLGL